MSNISVYREQFKALTNQYRKRKGLSTLIYAVEVEAHADKLAEGMAYYFSTGKKLPFYCKRTPKKTDALLNREPCVHHRPDLQRKYLKAHPKWGHIKDNAGMNIVKNRKFKSGASELFQEFVNSPGHNANLILSSHTHQSIGIYIYKNKYCFVSHNLLKIRRHFRLSWD